MFVVSVKTGKKQLLTALACIALVAVLATVSLLIPAPNDSIVSGTPVVSTVVGTGEERISFLKNLGYEVEEEAVQIREIRIPDEPDAALLTYNELQKQAGLDLEPYLGKRVKLYSYRVVGGNSASAAHLYVYRNTVIAGHVDTADGEQALL